MTALAGKSWAVAYTCAGGALRVNTQHASKKAAMAFMRGHIKARTAGLDLMAPWYLLPPGSYSEASVGGRFDETVAELVYAGAR